MTEWWTDPLYGVDFAAATGGDDVIDHVTDADPGTLACNEVGCGGEPGQPDLYQASFNVSLGFIQ